MKRIVLSVFMAAWLSADAEVITVTYGAGGATVGGDAVEGVRISVKQGRVSIKDLRDTEAKPATLTYVLSGESSDGQFKLNTSIGARVELRGLSLTCREGAAMHLKNKAAVELSAADGTVNRLCTVACNDTVRNKQAALWAKQAVNFCGRGTLTVEALGNGCKGINCKDDIRIEDLTLTVRTKGDNLGVDTTRRMGPPPMGGFSPDSIPAEVRAHFEEMMKKHRQKTGDRGGFPGPPNGDMGGGPGGKQKYLSTCKGIKAAGTITIASGSVSVETASDGAEGIEGKKGVTILGGTVCVKAVDDAINSGGVITIAGGKTTALSTANDAVDSNYGEEQTRGGEGGFPFMPRDKDTRQADTAPAIVVSGGSLMAWSMRGAPEEGLDCDFAPIAVSGGTLFTIGAGMGDMPSVPTSQTAKQPTVLAVGLNFAEGETVSIKDRQGQTLMSLPAPFTFSRSSSLISCPAFKVGETYTIVSGKESKSMELKDNFTIIR